MDAAVFHGMHVIRALVFLSVVLLCACPPVRQGDDDDSATSGGGQVETVWEGLSTGDCLVLPEGSTLLTNGAGSATAGLWYDVSCTWTGGNASSVLVQVEPFDTEQGGDFPATMVRAVDVEGQQLTLDGDLGSLHLLPGSYGTLNGWWEGDLYGTNSSGEQVRLDTVVFKDVVVEEVVGR